MSKWNICMAESLCSSPETVRTLLIGCTPIQNKKFLKMISTARLKYRLDYRYIFAGGWWKFLQNWHLTSIMTIISKSVSDLLLKIQTIKFKCPSDSSTWLLLIYFKANIHKVRSSFLPIMHIVPLYLLCFLIYYPNE